MGKISLYFVSGFMFDIVVFAARPPTMGNSTDRLPARNRTGFYLASLLLSTPGQRRLSYAQAKRGVSLCTGTASLQKRVP